MKKNAQKLAKNGQFWGISLLILKDYRQLPTGYRAYSRTYRRYVRAYRQVAYTYRRVGTVGTFTRAMPADILRISPAETPVLYLRYSAPVRIRAE